MKAILLNCLKSRGLATSLSFGWKLKGGIAPKTQPVSLLTFAGLANEARNLLIWLASWLRLACWLAARIARTCWFTLLLLTLHTSALAFWLKAVPRIFDTALHLLTALWVTTRKLALFCDNKAINCWCVTLFLAILVILRFWDYKQTTTEGYYERLFLFCLLTYKRLLEALYALCNVLFFFIA